MSDQTITHLIHELREGNADVLPELFAQVYDAIYAIAKQTRMRWHGDLTINTTALVNEAYIKLAKNQLLELKDRAHFYAVAGKAMRQILCDYAKKKQRVKRGSDFKKISLDEDLERLGFVGNLSSEQADAIVALDEALKGMENTFPRMIQVIECKFFSKMNNEETAEALGVSLATIKRDWTLAKAKLHKDIEQILGASST